MDWQPVFAIGALTLLLGAVLAVPTLWWAKRRARKNPAAAGSRRVSGREAIASGALVTVMFVPLTARFWAADTWFGQWVSTDWGAISYLVMFCLTIIAVGLLLLL